MSVQTIAGLEPTLPSSWYLKPGIFQLEREHIFLREWMCVGREEQVPAPGDHLVLDVQGENILIVRNPAGELRAFYNVCRHRGARLCPAPGEDDSVLALKGGIVARRHIVCAYHAWTYDLDGRLVSAPHLQSAAGGALGDVRLYPVGIATWGGFIFVNLTPDGAPSFEDRIREIAARYVRYPLADLRIARTITYEVATNWKVLCENYNECYHCGPVHPELCRVVPAFRDQGGASLDWERGVPHREGATTFTWTGESTRRSFPGLSEDEQVRHKGELVYPNLFVSLAREHVAAFVLKPEAPDRTIVDCHFLFEPHEMQQPGFEPSDVIDFWHLINRQDWVVCTRVQQGMSARVHKQGVYAPMEDANLDIRRYVRDRIGPHVRE
ncbi:MAG: aromatic ring-hydroxylating dioxygenase subunit alpha [Steroidobacteraceae bacterium]